MVLCSCGRRSVPSACYGWSIIAAAPSLRYVALLLFCKVNKKN